MDLYIYAGKSMYEFKMICPVSPPSVFLMLGVFVCGMMSRFNYGIFSANIDNGIFKSFFNI